MTLWSRRRTIGATIAHSFDFLLLLLGAWRATRPRWIFVERANVTIASFHALRRWRAIGGAHSFDLLLLLLGAWRATRPRWIFVEHTWVTIASFHALRWWRTIGGTHTFDL